MYSWTVSLFEARTSVHCTCRPSAKSPNS